MQDGIGTLVNSLTTALVPLPYLLKAGEKAAEEMGKKVGSESLEWARSLWSKLKPKVEAKPAALEAVQDAANMHAQAALRVQLRKLLAEDQSLAEEVGRWLEQRSKSCRKY